MGLSHRHFLAVPLLGLSLIASLAPAQFTQVTGTASDFVPEEQVKIDAQLEKEGRLILTKAIHRVPLDANQKVELKRILDGRSQTEKEFREVHKVPNATVRAFNLEQTRLAIEAIRRMLTPDQWHAFCAAQVESEDHQVVVDQETIVVADGSRVTSANGSVILLAPKKHVHKAVKVVKVVKAEKVHKAPKHHHVKVVHQVHPVKVAHPTVHRAPAHRTR